MRFMVDPGAGDPVERRVQAEQIPFDGSRHGPGRPVLQDRDHTSPGTSRDGNDDVVQIVRLECGQFVVENRKSLPPPEDPPVTGWPNIRKIGREELLPELGEFPHPRILAQDFEVCDPRVDLRPNNYGDFAWLLRLLYTHPSSALLHSYYIVVPIQYYIAGRLNSQPGKGRAI